MFSADGKPVYGLEIDTEVTTNPLMFGLASNLSMDQQKQLKAILSYGYRGTVQYGGTALTEIIATQLMVWTVTTDLKVAQLPEFLGDYPVKREILEIAQKISIQVQDHWVIPSFAGAAFETIPKIELFAKPNERPTATTTDDHHVLSHFTLDVLARHGVDVVQVEDTITFTAKENLDETLSFGIEKTKSKYVEQLEYVNPWYHHQWVGDFGDRQDPLTAYFSLTQQTISLNIDVADHPGGDASGNGTKYGVYAPSGELLQKVEWLEGAFALPGSIQWRDGMFLQAISAGKGYLLDPKTYIISGEDPTITVIWKVISGQFSIQKKLGDEGEPNVEFSYFLQSAGSFVEAKEHQRGRITTDVNGVAISLSLPMGIYEVHQTTGTDGWSFIVHARTRFVSLFLYLFSVPVNAVVVGVF